MNTKIYDKISCGGFHIGNGLNIHKEDNKEILSSVDVVVRYVKTDEDAELEILSFEGDYASIFKKMFIGKSIEGVGHINHSYAPNVAWESLILVAYTYSSETKQIAFVFGSLLNLTQQYTILLNPDNTWEEMG